MHRPMAPVLLAAATLALAACGHSQGDRMLSGAAIGAGGGTLIGALAGDPLAGTAIGAVGGAAVGALTNPNQLNLGKPIWH
jgi:osmotically inducible lipoprotein OsmB